ncbi:hypothetical protein GE061_006074 [Apolygus lucorum]|uniref:Uncharacterized protein n=1 Tax=Apolygus lucorum TaxID=248454 RepID=A0A6A4JEZ0_APOLU|nr:hypothetical protein GE061_006074 [Apolygus lucorum]
MNSDIKLRIVDCPPDEETESPSQTTASTSRRATSRKRHVPRRNVSSDRRWRHNDKDRVSTTPSPDETLLKPFTYRTRKDRLIDSLQAGGDQRNESNSEDDDSAEPKPPRIPNNEKLSVAKIVENIQANLIAKVGSNSSIRRADGKTRKPTNSPNVSKTTSGQTGSNSLLDVPERKKKVSSKKLGSRKQVMPTGVEEQIIETLIHPKRRRASCARVQRKDSSDSIDLHSQHAIVTFDNVNIDKKHKHKKSPPPPPVDFMDTSETESVLHTNPCSSSYPEVQKQDSNDCLEEKPTETSVPRGLPSHLKELKLRFSNDVPRSPHEDNLNDIKPATEKLITRHSHKPASGDAGDSNEKYRFTNDIPLVDSLHILASDKNGRKFVKSSAKRSKDVDQRSKNTKRGEKKEPNNSAKAAEKSRERKRDDDDRRELKSKPYKSILKSDAVPGDDDVINCFNVKAEYDEPKLMEEKDGRKHRKTRERGEGRESRRAHRKSPSKSARTQTSSTGLPLVDSSVQTWPDLALQLEHQKEAEVPYESVIENKAKQILKRFSVDPPMKTPIINEQGERKRERKKYRNGSTQWEEVDLLVNSSCEKVISKGRERDRNKEERSRKERCTSGRVSRKSKSEARMKIEPGCSKTKDVNVNLLNNEHGTEICCMHLQVVPGESNEKTFIKKETPRDNLDLLEKKERRSGRRKLRSCRESEQSLCRRCSQTQFQSSSEGMSSCVTYATSSCRKRELSLLSPFCSRTTLGTRSPDERKMKSTAGGKNEDLYRQMEELGLGFLRDGEWVPTDVISRTLWKNLEKCTENCQATWRRRSRSFTHTKTLSNTG